MTFAVVNIAGQQVKVTENTKYYVARLQAELNSEIEFEDVLVLSTDDETKIGAPNVAGVKVQAKVLEHLKDEKVLVFKKKRRKGYRKCNGHRQHLTRIEVLKIG